MRNLLRCKQQVLGKRIRLLTCAIGTLMLLGMQSVQMHASETTDRANYGQFSVSSDKLNFGLVEVGDRASQLLSLIHI